MNYLMGLIATCLVLLTPAWVYAETTQSEKITWGWFSAPPYMITDGEHQRQGIFDLIRQTIIQSTPELQHKEVLAPFPRLFAEVKRGANWCFTGAVKNSEREQFAYFSRPVALFLPFRIVVLKDSNLAQQAVFSLDKLLSNHELRTSVLRGRIFNPVVDELLRRHPPTQTHSEFNEALQMLLNKRLDYLIEFPVITHYQLSQINQYHRVKLLVPSEAQEIGYYRVMCAKTALGRQVVERVNQLMPGLISSQEYRRIVEKWADDASVLQIRDFYDKQFIKAD